MTGKQLKDKLLNEGYVLSDLANQMGMSAQAFQSKFDSPDLKLSFIECIAEAIKKSLYELIEITDGSGNKNHSVKAINKSKTDKKIHNQGVPYYDIPATAGAVSIFSRAQNHIPSGHISIPNMPKCDGAIPIVGDSMYPLLKSGDTVLYKIINDKSKILWGEMYIAMIIHNGDEYFFVKYINKSSREGFACFVSYNDHHQPVEFPIDSIQALALVKASIRINSNY